MATISKDGPGRYRIEYINPFGSSPYRPKIRLGKSTKRQAEGVKVKIESLIGAKRTGHPIQDDVVTWLDQMREDNPSLLGRLVALGLADRSFTEAEVNDGPEERTAKQLIDGYIETFGRTKKKATVTTWKQARRLFLEYFAPDTPISSITTGKAIEFQNFLRDRTRARRRDGGRMSEHTVRRRTGCIKQFFAHAVELELIPKNPFVSKKVATTLPRPKQKAFIHHDLSIRIMNQLRTPEWRVLFALARWGGLRVPSEPRLLTWGDVNWEAKRLTIHSPKTEHHEGLDKRDIPLFPEIYAPLRAMWIPACPRSGLILPFMQGKSDSAFRKPMIQAIEAAGGIVWEKLFNALRATRDTELRERFSSHVVDAWIGHDEAVAKRHYVQVTDDHYERGAHFAAQQAAEIGGRPQQTEIAPPVNLRAFPLNSAASDRVPLVRVGDEGPQPVDVSHFISNTYDDIQNPASKIGADSGALEVADAWTALSEEAKLAILSILRKSSE